MREIAEKRRCAYFHNVLYKGMTADDNHVVRRKITIVKRLRKYIDMLMEHKELETSLLPLGDGVTISVKK